MAIRINNHVVIDDNRGFVDVKNSPGLDKQIITSIGTATAWVSGAVIADSIDLGYVGITTYTTPGTFTVGTDCPSQISMIRIIGCGGGGNGGNGAATPVPATPGGGGGGGGGASRLAHRIVRVTNGQIFNITIAGANGNTIVTNPGPTPVVTFTGGSNGSNASGGTGGAGGSNGVPILAIDIFRQSESQDEIDSVNGTNGTFTSPSPTVDSPLGGPGGKGADNNKNYFYYDDIRIGTGGAGAVRGPTRTGSAATGRGAGGGGGAGGGSTGGPAGGVGGAGAPGIVIIVY